MNDEEFTLCKIEVVSGTHNMYSPDIFDLPDFLESLMR